MPRNTSPGSRTLEEHGAGSTRTQQAPLGDIEEMFMLRPDIRSTQIAAFSLAPRTDKLLEAIQRDG
jgi:hypothetical protein